MGRVSGKVALVTGGASGIGRGCAEVLAAEGAIVVVTDVQVPMGLEVVDGIKAAGGQAVFREQNVTSEDVWRDTIAAVDEQFGRLDILVNNAGIGIGGPITEMTLEDWRKQQAINVEGVFLGTKHALPLMRRGGGGSIINISSLAGLNGAPNLAAYCATKGAVRLFSKAVALECAGLRDGVRVNSVHPGIIETPIWDGISATTAAMGTGANRIDLDAVSAMATPLGVKGFPADIANGVLYLASDESRYVTGTELVIDGGMHAR
ncbi:SDR family NAD(P)-dependent oxidoreductase [Phenylobacterium montanum]|uniref:D-xylose 1-dehydrogenase n=1 Tax=Phenylobacterium montanum TaxID=2823693 RepID=A0A975G372_9CAUL|nr:glucose 1-dehydrogenase [Caulobacter sp. S6]QUD89959.1 glucose 1-dehydrogenase [Caulobacter sp. S6]